MKAIKSLAEVMQLAKDGNLYVRWSRGPALDKKLGTSMDQVSGHRHNGLSAQRISPDNPLTTSAMMLVEYRFLRSKDSKIYGWLFTATQVGIDSDNAPVVDAETIVPVGRLEDNLVEQLSAYKTDFWAYQRTSPKTIADRDRWYADMPKLADYT